MKKLLNNAVEELIERANNELVEMIRDNDERHLEKINHILERVEFLKEHIRKVFPENIEMINIIDRHIHAFEIKLAYLKMMEEINC